MACSLAPLIKASKVTGSTNSSTLNISALNLLKYAHVNSPFSWATLKSCVKAFFWVC